MGCSPSSRSSKKCLSLVLEAWNVIFQLLRILLHLFFLSNFHENLQERIGTRSNFLVSLSTSQWRVQLLQLEQFQNLIELCWFFLKKFPKFFKNIRQLDLKQVILDQWVKDTLSSMHWVCDNDNVFNIWQLGGLIDAISDSK